MADDFNENLSAKARSSVLWNAGFSLFRDLVQFCQAIVLARLIAPEAYGQFGLVTSIIGFLSIFSARSFVSHSLQVPSGGNTRFQEHFTAAAFIQGALFLGTNAVAFALGYSQTYGAAAIPIHVMSFTFLLDWPCEIRLKMLERSLDWKRRRLLHAIGLVAAMVLAIVMGVLKAGVYALLIPGLLVTVPFIYDLFVVAAWRPTWAWKWADYRPAFYFGLARLGGGLAASGRQLLEAAVLVSVIGFGPLGIVNRAIGLAQMACGKLGIQLMYAVYPILPRLDAMSGQATKAGNLILRLHSWLTIPIAVIVSMLGYPIVLAVYGSNWLEAVPLVTWAVVWVAFSSLLHVTYTLVLARDRSFLCLISDISNLVATGLSLWLLLPYGVVAYLQGITAACSAIIVSLIYILVRINSLSLAGVLTAIVPPAVCSFLAATSASLLTKSLELDISSFLPAVVWGLVFVGIYASALRVGFGRPLSELVFYFPGRASISRFLCLPC